jgi:hypothetical protein
MSFHLVNLPSDSQLYSPLHQDCSSLPVFLNSGYGILNISLFMVEGDLEKDSRLLISEVGAVFFLPNAASLTCTGRPNSLSISARPYTS